MTNTMVRQPGPFSGTTSSDQNLLSPFPICGMGLMVIPMVSLTIIKVLHLGSFPYKAILGSLIK